VRVILGIDRQSLANIESLQGMGGAVIKACSKGLGKAVNLAAGNVKANYLSGQSLFRRTGHLAASVAGWLVGELDGIVGVPEPSVTDRYKWLLGDEEKTIVPVKARFLCIPIGENLTGAGVARFSSPRQKPEGFFIHTHGRLLFGYKQGKKGKFRPLFALVKSVLVQGSGALADGVLDSIDDMTTAVQTEIDTAVSK